MTEQVVKQKRPSSRNSNNNNESVDQTITTTESNNNNNSSISNNNNNKPVPLKKVESLISEGERLPFDLRVELELLREKKVQQYIILD